MNIDIKRLCKIADEKSAIWRDKRDEKKKEELKKQRGLADKILEGLPEQCEVAAKEGNHSCNIKLCRDIFPMRMKKDRGGFWGCNYDIIFEETAQYIYDVCEENFTSVEVSPDFLSPKSFYLQGCYITCYFGEKG